MTPVLQMMIGIGIGIIGAILLTPLAIGYVNNHSNSRNRKSYSEFWSQPGEPCPICLENLDSSGMQYLACGHALHDNCYRTFRKRSASECSLCRAKV